MSPVFMIRSAIIRLILLIVLCFVLVLDVLFGAPVITSYFVFRLTLLEHNRVLIVIWILLVSLGLSAALLLPWFLVFLWYAIGAFAVRWITKKRQKVSLIVIVSSLIAGILFFLLARGKITLVSVSYMLISTATVVLINRVWDVIIRQSRTWYIR